MKSLYKSIAGKGSNKKINQILEELMECPYIPKQDKNIIEYTLKVAENGMYPDHSYYNELVMDYNLAAKYKNISEIKHNVESRKEFYYVETLRGDIIKIFNTAKNVDQLTTDIQNILGKQENNNGVLDNFQMHTYSNTLDEPKTSGIKSGVEDIDKLTYGFQPGTVFSICAFTGEGKSTWITSLIYKNIKEGKKGVLFNLEMTPEHTWILLQTRFIYEEKGMDINTQDLLFKKLDKERTKDVLESEIEFKTLMKNNLMIVDESILSLKILLDYRKIQNLMRDIECKLGGLDFVIWDHVHQLELMFPERGNQIIKSINSAVKTYVTKQGTRPVVGLAVQTNREGRKRAAKRNGEYDLLAIGDLNEVERASSYVCFMFTTDDSKLMQETKISMVKHRLGSTLPVPVITTFNPAVSVVGAVVETIESDDLFDDFTEIDEFEDIF